MSKTQMQKTAWDMMLFTCHLRKGKAIETEKKTVVARDPWVEERCKFWQMFSPVVTAAIGSRTFPVSQKVPRVPLPTPDTCISHLYFC